MAKKQTKTNQAVEQNAMNSVTAGLTHVDEKKFAVKLHIYMKPYEVEGNSGTSVTAELVEPFAEYAEDFTNIRVAPRWDKDSAIFKFRMGMYLKTADDLIVTGYCKPASYLFKKKGEENKTIYYPALFFKLPYSPAEIEFGFKKRQTKDKDGIVTFSDAGDSYVFRDLVSEKWGGSYEPGISSANDENAEYVADGASLANV